MDLSAITDILGSVKNPAVPLAQLGLGAYQAISSNRALKRLSKQAVPSFGITPEQTRSYNRAEELANTGLTGAERQAATQGLAQSGNQAYRRALNMSGGSTARGIQGALGAMNLRGQNQISSMDAGLRRRNVQYADMIGRGLSDQRNRETQRAYNYRMLLEQNLGLAKKIGLENIVNSMAYMGTGGGSENVPVTWGGSQQGLQSYPQSGGYGMPKKSDTPLPFQGGGNLPPSDLYNWPTE